MEWRFALSNNHVNEVDRHVFKQIDNSFDERMKHFTNSVHPAFAELFLAEKKELDILRAEGIHLALANGKQIMDMSSLGCSLRGHSPRDVIEKVVKRYDPHIDYFAQGRAKLRELSRFHHLLPSVSGAGAVDKAVLTAMLAQRDRKKIICFTGNYGGKTLVSVNLSKTAPLLADFDVPAFEPYYSKVAYTDPFAADAEARFKELAGAGDVALVWFELIQGYMFKRLPLHIVQLVERLKGVRVSERRRRSAHGDVEERADHASPRCPRRPRI